MFKTLSKYNNFKQKVRGGNHTKSFPSLKYGVKKKKLSN